MIPGRAAGITTVMMAVAFDAPNFLPGGISVGQIGQEEHLGPGVMASGVCFVVSAHDVGTVRCFIGAILSFEFGPGSTPRYAEARQ